MFVAKLFLHSVLALNLLLGGFIGSGPLWLCQDPDGTVSIEDASSRETCCTKRHEHNSDGTSVNGEPCCHDELISNGQPDAVVQPTPAPMAFVPLPLFFECARVLETVPTVAPARRDWTPLARGSPPLAQLATIVILV